MQIAISARELARKLGEVLGRVRHRADSFAVERNGEPVAQVFLGAEASFTTLAEAGAAWRAAGPPEAEFADELERIGRADRVPGSRWDS
jgi:hypothetical protein